MSTARTGGGDLAMILRLMRELRSRYGLLTLAILLYFPLTLGQLAQPLIIGRVVDQGMKAGNMGAVFENAGLYLAAVVFTAVITMAQLLLMQFLGQSLVRGMRERLFAKIQRLPMAYFDRVPLGRIMTRVSNDAESVSELFSSGAVTIIGDACFLIGTLIMLFLVDVDLSWRALIVMPFLAIGVQWFRVKARAAFIEVRQRLSQINAALQEQLSGMHVIQLFAQGQRVRASFEDENRGYMRANQQAIALDAGVYSFVDAMSTISVAVVLLAGTGLVEQGALTLGALVAFVDALGRFFIPIRDVSSKFTTVQSALVSVDRIYELENEPETITSKHECSEARFDRELAFEDVRFRYGDGPEILKGISFRAQKGQKIAIVGHTGAGKTTIVKLLPRLYDATAGRITIDGVDVRDIELEGLRKLVTAVPQDVFLFSGTLRDNLAYGRPDLDDATLLAAAKSCQADLVLERHGGLDGKVLERGQNLSMGERQLLALARALINDPPILILDEATASVDRETERRLKVATERAMEHRTALIVAHRLSTIERCDRILVLHQGEVVEEGTHDELQAAKGRYAMLVELQRREGG
jgi:ATP-binding cassette, subfamily B, multidrug efflux pump